MSKNAKCQKKSIFQKCHFWKVELSENLKIHKKLKNQKFTKSWKIKNSQKVEKSKIQNIKKSSCQNVLNEAVA